MKLTNVFLAAAVSLVLMPMQFLDAAVVFGLPGNGTLQNGSRWNATQTTFATSGGPVERSLAGGLRFSVSGSSYASYRDQFVWGVLPSESDFSAAINNAFTPWTAVDPVTGFGTMLSFAEDLGTSVNPGIENNIRLGAEIDLFSSNLGSGTRGETWFNANVLGSGVTLTSGTTGYGGFAINGADIFMNSNNAVWDLNTFQTILTHEIGHAIGLGDVEDFFGNGFIDDNYDPNDPLGALTNSWASLVNPLDPANSPGLSLYNVSNDLNGIDALGVDILMESNIPGTFFANGASLKSDDFGGRQFLYPTTTSVPEPSSMALCGMGIGVLALYRKRRIRTLAVRKHGNQ